MSLPYIVGSTSLKTLDLSHNVIRFFPVSVANIAGNLTELNLSKSVCLHFTVRVIYLFYTHCSNSIAELPQCSLELYCLESLGLAYNEIGEIPEQFLKGCISLTNLDLTKNYLGDDKFNAVANGKMLSYVFC